MNRFIDPEVQEARLEAIREKHRSTQVLEYIWAHLFERADSHRAEEPWVWHKAMGAWEAIRYREKDAGEKVERVLFEFLKLERTPAPSRVMGSGSSGGTWNEDFDASGYYHAAFRHVMRYKTRYPWKPPAKVVPGKASNWWEANEETKAFLREVVQEEAFRKIRQDYEAKKFRPLPSEAYRGMDEDRIPAAQSPESYDWFDQDQNERVCE